MDLLQVAADSLSACQATEMIIYSPVGFYFVPHLTEKLNLPSIGAYLQPFHRTQAFPSYVFSVTLHMGKFLNLLTYYPAEVLFWLLYRAAVNQIRQQLLNLSPIPSG